MVHSPSSDFLSRTIGAEELDTESVDASSYEAKPSSVVVDFLNNEQLLAEMQRALLDTEAKAAAISNKRNVIINFEKEIKKAFYRDEADAEAIASTRAHRISGITDEASPEDFVD